MKHAHASAWDIAGRGKHAGTPQPVLVGSSA